MHNHFNITAKQCDCGLFFPPRKLNQSSMILNSHRCKIMFLITCFCIIIYGPYEVCTYRLLVVCPKYIYSIGIDFFVIMFIQIVVQINQITNKIYWIKIHWVVNRIELNPNLFFLYIDKVIVFHETG